MKNQLMLLAGNQLLSHRRIIESLFGTVKTKMGLEHSRHRSMANAMEHVLSCLVATILGKPPIETKLLA